MMSFLVIMMLIGVALFTAGGCGVRCGARLPDGRRRSLRRRRRDALPADVDGPAPRRKGGALRRPATAPVRRETPLQSLQRRFVEGGLNVEEYEREIDRLELLA